MRARHGPPANDCDMDIPGILPTCGADGVGVVRAPDEARLVTTRPMAAGARLVVIEGEVTGRPSRYSVQVGEDLHIHPGGGADDGPSPDRYCWRFMNHSCDPNVCIRGREVIALRDIPPREAVTFDYNATEWDMAEPFACRCGSPDCLGTIRGFKHLTPVQRGRVRAVAPHLHRLASGVTPGAGDPAQV